jgi:hypothetical protein
MLNLIILSILYIAEIIFFGLTFGSIIFIFTLFSIYNFCQDEKKYEAKMINERLKNSNLL